MELLSMRIIDVTAELDDNKHHRLDPFSIDTIAIHRVGKDEQYGIDLGSTAVDIGKHFIGRGRADVAKATGGEQPYTFYVGDNGEVWQSLPLFDSGRHSRRWNARALGIACIGDFRFNSPSPYQLSALRSLCLSICFTLGINPDRIIRHDQLPGGSSDKSKKCPGHLMNVETLREEIKEELLAYRSKLIEKAGLPTWLPKRKPI